MSKIKCLRCNGTIESKYTHHLVFCGCQNRAFVDGGNEYLRYGAKDLRDIAIINDDHIFVQLRYGIPKLILVKGIPGSGKSTLAHKMKGDGVVLSTDDFFMVEGVYHWTAERVGAGHRWNQNRCRKAVQENVSTIVIDNTNLVAKEIKPYLDIIKKTDYGVLVAEPYNEHCRNAEVLFERNKHGVPMETIQRMLAKEEPLRDFCAKIRNYLGEALDIN